MSEFHYQTSELEALVGMQNYYGWILREIRPFLGCSLAEIGGGIGTFSDIIVDTHLQSCKAARLHVFEPAVNLHRRLKDRLTRNHSFLLSSKRLTVVNEYFESHWMAFDTVIMVNVLEHIRDDERAACAVYDALEPGGVFIVFSPALPWLYSHFDRSIGHCRRYTKVNLINLMAQAGFALRKVKYMDLCGIVPWYLTFVMGGSTSINQPMARLYDRCVVPMTRLIEDRWEPPIGKNLLVVGQKTL